MKIIKNILISLGVLAVIVILLGVYKFNFTDSDIVIVEQENFEHKNIIAQLDNDLVGTWVWTETQMNSDEGINPQPKSDVFSLTFTNEGRISGTTDCNNIMGTYELDGSNLSFGPLAATMMFCPDSQEMEFTKLISDVQSYLFSDNGNLVLLLPFDSGAVIFEKKKDL